MGSKGAASTAGSGGGRGAGVGGGCSGSTCRKKDINSERERLKSNGGAAGGTCAHHYGTRDDDEESMSEKGEGKIGTFFIWGVLQLHDAVDLGRVHLGFEYPA